MSQLPGEEGFSPGPDRTEEEQAHPLPRSWPRIPRCADEPAAIAGFLRRPASVLHIYLADLFFGSVGRVYGYLGGAPAVYMSTADATIEGSGAVATDVSFPS